MNKKLSTFEIVASTVSYLYTKIFFPRARLIRLPIYIRGKSSLTFKKGLTTGYNCRFDLYGGNLKTLKIGYNLRIGDNVHIVALNNIKIGDNCLFASKIFISDTSHGNYNGLHQSNPKIPPVERSLIKSRVFIGDNVWIGESVSILPNVVIGSGSIIGANSVVSKSIPSNCIAVGIPAKVIKKFNFKSLRWEKINEQY